MPAGAEAGRAAPKIAAALALPSTDLLGGWDLVRVGSGAPLHPTSLLWQAGLAPDELVRVVPSRAPTPATAVPLPSSDPRPPLAPPPALRSPSPTRTRTSPARIAVIGGFVVLSVAVVVLATLLVSGRSDDTPVAGPAPAAQGASAAPSASATASVSAPTGGGTTTQTRGARRLGDTPLSLSGGVTTYSVELPTGWLPAKMEQAQATGSDAITRDRTELNARSGGATLTIDALTGFDVPAQENRATLDAAYRAGKAGYRKVAFSTVPIGSTSGYEWRYVVWDEDKDRLARRVNVMFDSGSMAFAVMAGGTTSTPYPELSRLARRVARTVQP